MDNKKATIFQVVILVLALILSLFSWVATSIARGLSRVNYGINIPYYYVWIAVFIILGLLAKLIFRKNNLILPTIGAMLFVALLILRIIISETTHIIDITIYDLIFILLPISSVLGFLYK